MKITLMSVIEKKDYLVKDITIIDYLVIGNGSKLSGFIDDVDWCLQK